MSLEENMNSHTTDPWGSSIPEKLRCRFTNTRGVRCSHRLFDATTGLCSFHERIWSQEAAADARATAELLTEDALELLDRDEIHVVLARLFRFVAEKRIEQSQGSLLAYITSLVLQTLPLRELDTAADNRPLQVIWDICQPTPPATAQTENGERNQTDQPVLPSGDAAPQG
jgi:hypothetical protein